MNIPVAVLGVALVAGCSLPQSQREYDWSSLDFGIGKGSQQYCEADDPMCGSRSKSSSASASGTNNVSSSH